MNAADIAWMLMASGLVMMMTPAVGLFYGGMIRKKNVLSTLMMCFAALVVVTLQWVLFGYSLAFGPDVAGLIGNLDWAFLNTVGMAANPDYAANLPHLAYCLFQMKFAAITPALIVGSFVERVKFSSFLMFTLLWATLVYDPLAHWVWSPNGWLHQMGALDFAGGTVIHIAAGLASLAAALCLRKRVGFGDSNFAAYNITLTVIGAMLLWFGWFGFNGGSALAANGLAVHAVMATNLAAASAAFTWMLLTWNRQNPSVTGLATGAVVGLVAITPACGYVSLTASLFIGVVAAVLSFYAIQWMKRFRVDDSLDVFACHGVAGMWGALSVGLFADKAINAAGANGLFLGNISLLHAQLVSILAACVWSFGVTFIIIKLIDLLHGFCVPPINEEIGLDVTQHGEGVFQLL